MQQHLIISIILYLQKKKNNTATFSRAKYKQVNYINKIPRNY